MPLRYAMAGVILLVLALIGFSLIPTKTPSVYRFGEPISLSAGTEIAEILRHPARLEGKTVRVEGKVVNACPLNCCWFEVGDGPLRILIDGGKSFPIRKNILGKWAVVQGRVENRRNEPVAIVPKGVVVSRNPATADTQGEIP